jgi:hypothetical protein
MMDADRKIRWTVIGEVLAERSNQIDTHGRTTALDDKRTTAEFAWLLGRRASDLATPFPEVMPDDEPRRLLIELAAIAVAAIEAMDRRASTPAVPSPADHAVSWRGHNHLYVEDPGWAHHCSRCELPASASIHYDS